jgi:hypothetical protein
MHWNLHARNRILGRAGFFHWASWEMGKLLAFCRIERPTRLAVDLLNELFNLVMVETPCLACLNACRHLADRSARRAHVACFRDRRVVYPFIRSIRLDICFISERTDFGQLDAEFIFAETSLVPASDFA